MIDHITFGTTDFARSTAFYDQALAPLGVKRLFDVPDKQSNGHCQIVWLAQSGYGPLPENTNLSAAPERLSFSA